MSWSDSFSRSSYFWIYLISAFNENSVGMIFLSSSFLLKLTQTMMPCQAHWHSKTVLVGRTDTGNTTGVIFSVKAWTCSRTRIWHVGFQFTRRLSADDGTRLNTAGVDQVNSVTSVIQTREDRALYVWRRQLQALVFLVVTKCTHR